MIATITQVNQWIIKIIISRNTSIKPVAVVNPDKYYVTEMLTLETNNIQPEWDEINLQVSIIARPQVWQPLHSIAAAAAAALQGPFPFPAMRDTF